MSRMRGDEMLRPTFPTLTGDQVDKTQRNVYVALAEHISLTFFQFILCIGNLLHHGNKLIEINFTIIILVNALNDPR